MRVTQSMLYQTTRNALGTSMENVLHASEQVSTTRRLNRPSDNPADVRSAVKLRDSLAELDQFSRNVETATRWADAADTALGSAGEVIQRASELALEGANGSLSDTDRSAILKEVEQLAASLAASASAKAGDQYIFSGYRVDRAPYTLIAGATVSGYQGDHGAIAARIGPDSQTQVNLAGDGIFQDAFDALKQLHDDLQAGQVQQATIGQVAGSMDTLLNARAVVGATANRLDETKTAQQVLVEDSKKLLSNLEDADMAEAITELTERQATYDAALKVNARIMQNSLIDYLR